MSLLFVFHVLVGLCEVFTSNCSRQWSELSQFGGILTGRKANSYSEWSHRGAHFLCQSLTVIEVQTNASYSVFYTASLLPQTVIYFAMIFSSVLLCFIA